MKHFEDIASDAFLLKSDIICLHEIWFENDDVTEEIRITEFDLHLNRKGMGKGIAIYLKKEIFDIKEDYMQLKLNTLLKCLKHPSNSNNLDRLNGSKKIIQYPQNFISGYLTRRESRVLSGYLQLFGSSRAISGQWGAISGYLTLSRAILHYLALSCAISGCLDLFRSIYGFL